MVALGHIDFCVSNIHIHKVKILHSLLPFSLLFCFDCFDDVVLNI